MNKDIVNQIIKYETGRLTNKELIALFQSLVDSGDCWKLQGHYGRTAADLLCSGLIKPPKKLTVENSTDYWGNKINWDAFKNHEEKNENGKKNIK